MKGIYVSVLVVALVVLAVTANDVPAAEETVEKCETICTFDYKPVCAYNGKCYRTYGNECTLRNYNCKTKSNLKTVDMEMCEQAQEGKNQDLTPCEQDS